MKEQDGRSRGGSARINARPAKPSRTKHTRSSYSRPSLDEGMINFSNRARTITRTSVSACLPGPARSTRTHTIRYRGGDADETAVPSCYATWCSSFLLLSREILRLRRRQRGLLLLAGVARRSRAVFRRNFPFPRTNEAKRGAATTRPYFHTPAVPCRKRDLSPLGSPIGGCCLGIYFARLWRDYRKCPCP